MLLLGLLLVVGAIPLMLRKVPPNWAYGLRVPATYADRWVWYEANAKSRRDLFILGVVMVVTALALEYLVEVAEAARTAAFFLLFGCLVVVAVVGWVRASRLLRRRRREQTAP